MSETGILITLIVLYMFFREYMFSRQVQQLQELLQRKPVEYEDSPVEEPVSGRRRYGRLHDSQNTVMESPNTINIDDPEFDISKVTSVNVDGEERPITIL